MQQRSPSRRGAYSLILAFPLLLTLAAAGEESSPAPMLSPWSEPKAMEPSLQYLAELPEFATWANAVRQSLNEVLRSSDLTDDGLAQSFSALERLGRQEVRRDGTPDAVLQRQQAYAVRRRVGLWKVVAEASRRVAPNQAYSNPTWMADHCERMLRSIDALETALDARQSGNTWRQVFQISELRGHIARCSPSELSAQRQLVRTILDQIDAMKQFRGGDSVWELPSMIQFVDCLGMWAIEPVSLPDLLEAVEDLEQHPSDVTARTLARTTRGLLSSNEEAYREIGAYLETHYRNANVRLVLSDTLINRVLPAIPPAVRPVRDSMFGAQISGKSYNTAHLSVKAVQDSDAWNLLLKAEGRVSTSTRAHKGPVVMYDQGQSEFVAHKAVIVDHAGIHSGHTNVTARGHTRLRGLETRLDKIPILRSIVRHLAQEERAKRLPKARRLFANRVVRQVRGEIDQKMRVELNRAEQAYTQRVWQPLTDLALDPQSLQLSTTADHKLLVRYRVAADNQLAAFTARPRDLSDSLLSLQIHQSILNNAIGQLGLAGRRVELSQLLLEIAKKMQFDAFRLPDDLPENVILRFAASDPLRMEFQDGQITVKIRLAYLSTGRRRWKNFEARAHYVPHVRGVQVVLQREESVELLGRRLSFRDQIALRGIFTKVFSKNRELSLLKPDVVEHPALADAEVSGLEIRDGWIGMSLSDTAPVTATASHRKTRRR